MEESSFSPQQYERRLKYQRKFVLAGMIWLVLLMGATYLIKPAFAEPSSDPVPAAEETEIVVPAVEETEIVYTNPEGHNNFVESFVVATVDNREVVCVLATESKQGGLSCDWANAVAK